MNERMTYDEMKTRFAGEWVLMDELEKGPHLSVVSARILFHSPDKDALHEKTMELRPKRFASFYFPIPGERKIFLLRVHPSTRTPI